MASSILSNQIVQTLLAGPLQTVTDPANQALITRNAELLATATARALTMSPDEQPDIQDDINAATAVLASMASAIQQEGVNAVRNALAEGIQLGLQAGFKVVAAALVTA